MTFESELAKLTLERSLSVNQIAKLWGDKALILSPETPKVEPDRPGLTGSQLITRLHANAKDLHGRVAGRNKDDAGFLCKGLEVLAKEWELLEDSLQRSEQSLIKARAEGQGSETMRTASLSSPDSLDSHYVAKQHRRIQQLEEREAMLQDELRQLKAKWEAIMARTMEQQASIHRQQMKEREELVAQKEAELKQLRQQLPLAIKGPAAAPSKGNIAAVRPAMRHEQYLMAGRMVIGQTLQILGPCDENAPDRLQWYRVLSPRRLAANLWGHSESDAFENLPDARTDGPSVSFGTVWMATEIAVQYSPEPMDVGYALGCCITPYNSASAADVTRVSSQQPVAMYPGFEEWVDSLAERGGAEFNVIVVTRNGMLHTNRELCALEIEATHITLRLPNAVTLQQPYTAAMQVCGARGAGGAAAQGVFLAIKPNEVYMLACETARDRNACIMLIRQMAALHGLSPIGPEEPMLGRA